MNIRHVSTANGTFLSCVINALNGPSDNPVYVRFDITVVGKETTSLVSRCQKAVDEDKKVLLGFTLSNPSTDIFTLKRGDRYSTEVVGSVNGTMQMLGSRGEAKQAVAQQTGYKQHRSHSLLCGFWF
ncbi:DUF3577 domain-containing protein [Xenorhabdus griffiniae]|nr:DUF3577 domain-containing protein [Xenorhabdus griffiniae]MDC9604134.1 DUF3577 domain-containing protein [Xenorhabdus griffiniae]